MQCIWLEKTEIKLLTIKKYDGTYNICLLYLIFKYFDYINKTFALPSYRYNIEINYISVL